MKKQLIILPLLVLGVLPGLRSEQGEGPSPDKHGPRPRAVQERSGKRPTPPPVMEYLEQLKESNPEKYQRFKRLREENPEAFRNELRKNAWGRREDRKNRFDGRPHPLQEQIDKVNSAKTPEAREVAIAALRKKISERVEQNLKERQEAIDKFRRKLKQLEEQNEQERIRREEIIDLHLKRLLENKTTETPPPPHE